MDQEASSTDLANILRVLLRRAPIVVLCAVVAAAAAYAISKTQRKQYTATASIVFKDQQLTQQAAGLVPTASADPQAQIDTNLKLATLPLIADSTARALHLPASTINDAISVSAESDTNLATIDATAYSPTQAARMANRYAQEVIAYRERSDRSYYASALRTVQLEYKALPPAQQNSSQGTDLKDRAASLQILAQLQGNEVQLAQPATVPGSPSSPKITRNTALGLVLGLAFGIALALALERFDMRLRTPGDLENVYGLPLVGVVPESSALRSGISGSKLPEREKEIFGLLRAHLRYFNVDRPMQAVVVVSAAPADGKSTVARNLALAAARAGERVLYMEADLRRPSAARGFNIDTGPGLSDALLDNQPLEECVQRCVAAEGVSDPLFLDVLPAGYVLPPSPPQVTESHAMAALLERARALYDLIVIDTPPLAAVPDAFPMLQMADGALIVGRVGKSRRDVAKRLRSILATTEAHVVGVVANGLRERGPTAYQYGYSYRYGSNRNGNGGTPGGKRARTASNANASMLRVRNGVEVSDALATDAVPTGRDTSKNGDQNASGSRPARQSAPRRGLARRLLGNGPYDEPERLGPVDK